MKRGFFVSREASSDDPNMFMPYNNSMVPPEKDDGETFMSGFISATSPWIWVVFFLVGVGVLVISWQGYKFCRKGSKDKNGERGNGNVGEGDNGSKDKEPKGDNGSKDKEPKGGNGSKDKEGNGGQSLNKS